MENRTKNILRTMFWGLATLIMLAGLTVADKITLETVVLIVFAWMAIKTTEKTLEGIKVFQEKVK